MRKEMSQPFLHKPGFFSLFLSAAASLRCILEQQSFLNMFYGAVISGSLVRERASTDVKTVKLSWVFVNAGLLALANLIISTWVWAVCMRF